MYQPLSQAVDAPETTLAGDIEYLSRLAVELELDLAAMRGSVTGEFEDKPGASTNANQSIPALAVRMAYAIGSLERAVQHKTRLYQKLGK